MCAMTASRAAKAKRPKQRDCEELEDVNASHRRHIRRNSGDQRLLNKNNKNRQEGTTISSCKIQPTGGGAAKCSSAHSNQVAQERFPSRLIAGGDEKVRSGKKSVMCSDKKHRPPYKQKSGHAEARIFDTLGKKKGLKLVFKIDWRPTSGGNSNMPCPACQRLMCIAMKCQHQIWLCNDENKPMKLTKKDCETDENGNITQSALESLENKMR